MADEHDDLSDLMSASEAREVLGISTRKLAELFRTGILTAEHDPLDKRLKMVSRKQVEALAARSRPKNQEAA
jgi:hypothetical protein